MQHLQFQVPEQLVDAIQLIWGMAGDNARDVFPRERILPDGIVELVFHFAQPLRTIRADGSSYVQPQAFAISQMHEFIELESNGQVGFVAVRFFPWGAHHFFDVPVSDFLDDAIECSKLWPDDSRELEALTDPALDWNERVEELTTFLRRQMHHRADEDVGIDEAIKQIRRSGGQVAVGDIGRILDVSSRQLQRKFTAAVGTSPKSFACVSRFLYMCRHLANFRNRPLIELAQECGFYDQSHFNREFKRFSGFTPKEFFEKENVGYADL